MAAGGRSEDSAATGDHKTAAAAVGGGVDYTDSTMNNGGGGEPSWTLLLPPPPQHDDSPLRVADASTAPRPSTAGPVLICLFLMVGYVGCSAVLLAQLRGGSYLDSLYFCFMTILTIGHNAAAGGGGGGSTAAALWADPGGGDQQASLLGSLLYILIGLILEATCLHILYEEVFLKLTSGGISTRKAHQSRLLSEVT